MNRYFHYIFFNSLIQGRSREENEEEGEDEKGMEEKSERVRKETGRRKEEE